MLLHPEYSLLHGLVTHSRHLAEHFENVSEVDLNISLQADLMDACPETCLIWSGSMQLDRPVKVKNMRLKSRRALCKARLENPLLACARD